MKKIYLITIIVILFVNARLTAQSIVISDVTQTLATNTPLDGYSTSKGLLIHRIALTSKTTAASVNSPEASLLIYNSATTGNVIPGYYYWNGSSKWVRITTSSVRKRTLKLLRNMQMYATENQK